MNRYWLISIILSLCLPIGVFSLTDKNPMSNNTQIIDNGDELSQSYRVLGRTGGYEDKKKAVKVYIVNKNNPRVLDMVIDLLNFYYQQNMNFSEEDQVAYYDDVIAEELIKLLDQIASPKSFGVLLHIGLYNKDHRDSTVKAAWKAISNIKW